MPSSTTRRIRRFYEALYAAFGPQHWWAAESDVEIVVGAILTQNTNWRNVLRAIDRLRAERCLTSSALRDVKVAQLAEWIRPAGYYNVKARRLKNFVSWLWETHNGELAALAKRPLHEVRAELLSINGIGPETADTILLYAVRMPTFVVDAYTRRIAERHGLFAEGGGYEELKALFEGALRPDERMFNEYHALIVAVGKRHCRSRAQCEGCPLARFEHAVDG